MNSRPPTQSIAAFLLLLCVFSAVAYALIIHLHHETAALSRFVMWCPGFAALCSCLWLNIPTATLGWRWPSAHTLRLAYFLPFVYATPVYVLVWLAVPGAFVLRDYEAVMARGYGLERWPVLGTFGVALPLLFTVTVLGTAIWTLGEELGWRGFLFPRLQEQFGFHGACVITGVIWAVWHYPGLLWADYNAGTNQLFAVACFTVMVIAMSYVMGYLRVRSDSIWPCVLLHATHNSFVQGIFDPLTAAVGWAKYATTEFGLGLAITMILAAILVARASVQM